MPHKPRAAQGRCPGLWGHQEGCSGQDPHPGEELVPWRLSLHLEACGEGRGGEGGPGPQAAVVRLAAVAALGRGTEGRSGGEGGRPSPGSCAWEVEAGAQLRGCVIKTHLNCSIAQLFNLCLLIRVLNLLLSGGGALNRQKPFVQSCGTGYRALGRLQPHFYPDLNAHCS